MSEYVGRCHDNTTLCLACHPHCADDMCVGFFPGDVSCCNVGQSCDRCGRALPGSDRRDDQ